MLIIPAIDIFEGNCVRLSEGEFSSRISYSSDPVTQAQLFMDAGATHLHVVDLEGAKNGAITNWATLKRLLALPGMTIQVGGGIRTAIDIETLLSSGADRVVIGSVAIRSYELFEEWVARFGAERFCTALDTKHGLLAFNGWQSTDRLDLTSAMERIVACKVRRILSTDISRDGMLTGPNLEYYRSLVQSYPSIEWLASGGVSTLDDVQALKSTGVTGAIIGKALYEETITLKELFNKVC